MGRLLFAPLAIAAVLLLASGVLVGVLLASAGDEDEDTASPRLERTGGADSAFLGLTLSSGPFRGADRIGLFRGQLRVEAVEKDGPADKAGIQPGDVIRSIDGAVLKGEDDLRAAVRARKPGDRIQLTYERDDKELRSEVRLGSAPATVATPSGRPNAPSLRGVPSPLRDALESLVDYGALSPSELRALAGAGKHVKIGRVKEASVSSLTVTTTTTREDLTTAVNSDTRIQRGTRELEPTDLRTGELVIVISLDSGKTADAVLALGD
jgi:membrane-associated protease RseP (regulator of RpoE activity)